MKSKILSTHFDAIVGVMIVVLILGCASPLLKATPDQLRQYPTEELVQFYNNSIMFSNRVGNPAIIQEINRRINEDLKYLEHNAKSLGDFRYSYCGYYKTEPMACQIKKEYPGIISIDFGNARRQWYVKTHPDISSDIRECILNSESEYDYKLKLGMTEDQVIAAIGFPNDINRSTGSWGVDEQWVYGGMIGGSYFPAKYFYFTNGKLTSIQD